MSETRAMPQSKEAEISFSKIGQRLNNVFRFLLRKWWMLLLAMIVGAVLGWLYCLYVGKKYESHCTFTVQGQSASSSLVSSAISLASSLGITSKGGSPTSYDNNFFATLLQSRRIVKETLLQSDLVNHKNDILANHFIHINQLSDSWKDNNRLKNFKFVHSEISGVSRLEDSVLNYIYDNIMKDYLDVVYETSDPFNTATFTSSNYDFSRTMMKRLITNISTYYQREMFSLNNSNLATAERRVDSLGNAIHQLDAKVARLKDNSGSVIKQSGLIDLNAAIRDQSLLNIQYSSAVNNYELAKVTLMTQAPILDVIDDPQFSTEAILPPIILAPIGGAVVLLFLVAGFLSLRLFIKETIQKENADEAQLKPELKTAE